LLKGHNRFGQIISGAADCTIRVWNAETGEQVCCLKEHQGTVTCLKQRDDVIISGSSDASLRIWSTQNQAFPSLYTPVCIRILYGHEAAIKTLDFRDALLVSGSLDGSVRLWHLDSGNCLRILHATTVPTTMSFSSKSLPTDSNFRSLTDEEKPPAVSCLQLTSKSLVFATYDGTIFYYLLNRGEDSTEDLQDDAHDSSSNLKSISYEDMLDWALSEDSIVLQKVYNTRDPEDIQPTLRRSLLPEPKPLVAKQKDSSLFSIDYLNQSNVKISEGRSSGLRGNAANDVSTFEKPRYLGQALIVPGPGEAKLGKKHKGQNRSFVNSSVSVESSVDYPSPLKAPRIIKADPPKKASGTRKVVTTRILTKEKEKMTGSSDRLHTFGLKKAKGKKKKLPLATSKKEEKIVEPEIPIFINSDIQKTTQSLHMENFEVVVDSSESDLNAASSEKPAATQMQPPASLPISKQWVLSLKIDGWRLICGRKDGTVIIWNHHTEKKVTELFAETMDDIMDVIYGRTKDKRAKKAVTGISFDDKYIVAGGMDGQVKIWEVES
jgi:WD40 repeat protein